MAGLNKMAIIGNLGRPVSTRTLNDGTEVANFSVAVNEKKKGEDSTTWFKVTAFSKLASVCSQYLDKGSSVYIEGRLQTNEWATKEGEKRFDLEIIAQNMVMLGGRDSGGNNARQEHDQKKRDGYQTQQDDPPF